MKTKRDGYTQNCGLAWSFCVAAFGGGDTQASEGVYAARSRQSGYSNNGDYIRYSGTSMAAPQVSGIAATLMEKFPSLTPAQIATRIKTTASMSGLYTKYGNSHKLLNVLSAPKIWQWSCNEQPLAHDWFRNIAY